MFFLIFLITLVSAMSLFVSIYSAVDAQYIYSIIYILISVCSGYISYSLIENKSNSKHNLNQTVLFTSIAAIIFSISALMVPLIPRDGNGNIKDTKDPQTQVQPSTSNTSSQDKFSKSVKDKFDVKIEVKMAAEIIGAADGYKWITENSSIEIYRFDKSTDSFKKVKDRGKISIEGLGEFPILINGDYVMITSDNQDINNWFNNFK